MAPFLPVGEYGPYPENLRTDFEGVVWRFRNAAKWRELPGGSGTGPVFTAGSGSGGMPGCSPRC